MKSVFLLVDIGFTGYDNLNSSKLKPLCGSQRDMEQNAPYLCIAKRVTVHRTALSAGL